MTFGRLCEIIKDNGIPDDVHLTSDSGWECEATEMDGIFYNEEKNEIVFTQGEFDSEYEELKEWQRLAGVEEEDDGRSKNRRIRKILSEM